MKFVAISMCVLFCSLVLRERNRETALIVSVAGVAILFFSAIGKLYEIVEYVQNISSFSPSVSVYIKLMLKILGISLITQIVCDICRDNGENALASMTAIAAKLIVVSMIIPLFETVINIIGGLVK